jgi:hypothetical protein
VQPILCEQNVSTLDDELKQDLQIVFNPSLDFLDFPKDLLDLLELHLLHFFIWLATQESNLHSMFQKHLSYH